MDLLKKKLKLHRKIFPTVWYSFVKENDSLKDVIQCAKYFCHNFAKNLNLNLKHGMISNFFLKIFKTKVYFFCGFCPIMVHCALVKLLVKRFVAWGAYIVLATTEHYPPPPPPQQKKKKKNFIIFIKNIKKD